MAGVDRLTLEMARFEQEVLGVAATAPPKPSTKPTPLIPLPSHHSSLSFIPPPNPPKIPSLLPSTSSIPPLIPTLGGGSSSTSHYGGSSSSTHRYEGGTSLMERAAEAVAMHQSLKSNRTVKKKRDAKKLRKCGDQVWEDPTLDEWDTAGYRIFCGDLGNDVNDDTLAKLFSRYSSFQKAKVVRDKWTKKTKGYGFVSFKDPHDYMQAMKEINGKYVGSRPIRLKKSTWKDRGFLEVKKKEKEKKKMGLKI